MSAVLSTPATSPAASAADRPLLRLQNVESAYGPIKAIRGVSLQVRRGEIAAVLGSNGAGKTTILKTISGIIDPRKGSIEFQGADITANDPAAIVRRGLMHVPEGREVFPLLSVRDNLLMGAYTRKDRDGVARDIEQVFSYFPILKERMSQDAGLLSGGQQQMLAISRALMAKPDLMLLDIEMPRMDGFDLARNVRADARLKDVPIIMITSRTGEKHRERAMAIGVNEYLGKPYQESDLLENILKLVKDKANG